MARKSAWGVHNHPLTIVTANIKHLCSKSFAERIRKGRKSWRQEKRPEGTPVRVLAAGRVAVGGETAPAGKRLPLAAAGALTKRYAIRFFAGEDGVYATVRPLGLALSFK